MNTNRVFSVLATLFLICSKSYAVETIILDDEVSVIEIREGHVHIYEDPSNMLTADQVSGLSLEHFNQYNSLFNRNPHSTYWLKFKIDARIKDKRKWGLEILDSRFNEVQLYFFNLQE